MAKPTFQGIASGMEGWDVEVSNNFSILQDGPVPIFESAGDETTLATDHPPGLYDRCMIFVNHSTKGWLLYFSNGSTWIVIGKAASSITKFTISTGGSPGDTLAAIPNPTDSPASADALRDDITTNIIPILKDSINSLGKKINDLIDGLKATGQMS